MGKWIALPGTVMAAPGDLERTDQGQQLVPGSALAYGREVWPPWAVVVASGDPEVPVGARIICQNDEGAPKWNGMRVVHLRTSRIPLAEAAVHTALARARRHAGKRPVAPEEVAAILNEDGEYTAVGTRVVVELLQAERPSLVLNVVGATTPLDWGIVTSVGARVADVEVGDVVGFRHDVGHRWTLDGLDWASVREAEVDLVDELGDEKSARECAAE